MGYSLFLLTAFFTDQLVKPAGIGVLQNPPFFAHMFATFFSIPFFVLLVTRTAERLETAGPETQHTFLEMFRRSRFCIVVFVTGFLVGLFSLAASIVMAASFEVDIYDSVFNTPTFVSYTLLRGYQYLICYPLLVVSCIILPLLLFRSLALTRIGYRPFDIDQLGGLKTYLRTYDGPVFWVQSAAVAIALANYIGWGGFETVSIILSVGAPLIVTVLAAFLYISLWLLVRSQKRRELLQISKRQETLYRTLVADRIVEERASKEIADELEANARLAKMIRSNRNFGWVKYFFNLSVTLSLKLFDKEVFAKLFSQLVT